MQMFCKMGVCKNFENFTWKRLCQSLFFNKVVCAATDSGTGVFLLNTSMITRFAHHNSADQPESIIQNREFSKPKREMTIEDFDSNEYSGITHTSLSRTYFTIDFFCESSLFSKLLRFETHHNSCDVYLCHLWIPTTVCDCKIFLSAYSFCVIVIFSIFVIVAVV